MDEWDAECKRIEYEYNYRLYTLNKIRHAVSRELDLMQQEEEKQRLSLTRKARKTREQNKSKSVAPPVRRSARILQTKQQVLIHCKLLLFGM